MSNQSDSFGEDTVNKNVQTISVKEAAQALGKPEAFVRRGLQQKVFPWGYAVKMGAEYSYLINKKTFEKVEGIE